MSRVLDESPAASAAAEDATDVRVRWRVDLRRIAPYAIVFFLALVAAALMLRPWSYGPEDVAYRANDPLWVQAMMQLHGQVGIFGVSDHLAWPDGASPWSLPQLGIFAGGFAWVTIGLLGLSPSAATTWFVVVSAGLNAGAILYLLRGVVGSAFSVLAGTTAICLGSSYWVMTKWGTANLALFAVIPLALGVLVRWERVPSRQRWGMAALVAAVAVASPLWWVLVAAMFLPFLALPPLFRRAWPQLRGVLVLSAAAVLGVAVQGILSSAAAGPMSDVRRQPWDSDRVGGNLAMLVHSSPFANQVVGPLDRLNGVGWWESPFGAVMVVLAVVAIVVLVAVPPSRVLPGVSTAVLSSATIVALLYYLIGGLGNLQSGLAVVMGTVSPARWWSRMLVVVAILGAVWLVALLRRRHDAAGGSRGVRWRRLGYGLAGLMVAMTVLDYAAEPDLVLIGPVPQDQAALQFLADHTEPCPVAQLPVNGVPNSRLAYQILDVELYRGLMPYVLAPDYFWSAGAASTFGSPGLAALPSAIGAKDLASLRSAGYCAVLFSKGLAQQSVEQNVDLPGREITGVTPDYDSARFGVYLLSR